MRPYDDSEMCCQPKPVPMTCTLLRLQMLRRATTRGEMRQLLMQQGLTADDVLAFDSTDVGILYQEFQDAQHAGQGRYGFAERGTSTPWRPKKKRSWRVATQVPSQLAQVGGRGPRTLTHSSRQHALHVALLEMAASLS